jgi:hypothetical protein
MIFLSSFKILDFAEFNRNFTEIYPPEPANPLFSPSRSIAGQVLTDQQLVHRLPMISGIIAPPYDRVRKPS